MEFFDVVIIGAGPASLNCANFLKKSNKKILILEKNTIIGKKVCAGGLTQKAYEYLNLPPELIEYSFKNINFNAPIIKSEIKNKNSFVYTVDRVKLSQWQQDKLKKSSIKIRNNSMVTKIENNYIVVNNKKIKYKYLVGGDGSSSIVRRYLGLKINDIDIAIQYIIPTKKFKKFEIFFDSRLFHSWYAWIFPHENYVSIGCGCNPKKLSSQKLKNNFHDWLKQINIDYASGEFQAHPINYDYRGLKFNNIFLIGDAAGLASGFTGEGIYQALISGEEVAKMILDKNYEPQKIKKILKIKKRHNKIIRLLNKSGPLRNLEYNLVGLLLKIKIINKKTIDFFG